MNFKDIILNTLAPAPSDNGRHIPGFTAYGDSIFFGTAIGRRFATLMPHLQVIDRSMPGDTAQNVWRRMPYDIRSTSVVVLQPGTNDLSVGRDPVAYLHKMVIYLLREGRLPVLTGITPRMGTFPTAEVNERLMVLAEDCGIPFAGWSTAWLVAADGLHPDEPMAQDLAERLAETLANIKELQ